MEGGRGKRDADDFDDPVALGKTTLVVRMKYIHSPPSSFCLSTFQSQA